jgi:hypothetical protein
MIRGWSWAAAAYPGVSHLRSNLPLQDAYKCFSVGDRAQTIVAIVSDGAGSASHGGQGASLVCRSFAQKAREEIGRTGSLPEESSALSWLDEIRDRIFATAERRSLVSRDFAATLLFVASTGNTTTIFHVGDGCIVVRDATTARWIAPIWPTHGEYVSTTSFVTDDLPPVPQYARLESPIDALAVFSDGLERLVLDFQTQQPHSRFFDRVITPVERSEIAGRNAALSVDLKSFLNGNEINDRTDDDKSLVLASLR